MAKITTVAMNLALAVIVSVVALDAEQKLGVGGYHHDLQVLV